MHLSKTGQVLNDVMGSEEKSTSMSRTCGYMMTAGPDLLALPDDVLLIIMSYLGPFDLLSVARLSERLEELAQDRTLWTIVDTRPNRVNLSQLGEIVEQLRPTTRTLAARGLVTDQQEKVSISPGLLIQICSQCPALDTLILEEQYAEIKQSKKQSVCKQIHLKLFPKTLTTLSLKGCDFQIKTHQESFFHDINVHLPLLKVLILSGCSWVYPHDFIPIGKCNMLEELRMDGCHRLGECVAYTSLAARFGFPALKILDLRDTNMGDSDVTCFNRTTTLTHLYLECPSNPRNHMNHLSGCYNTRNKSLWSRLQEGLTSEDELGSEREFTSRQKYGWTEYIFPEGSPIIVINRLGQNVECREEGPSAAQEEEEEEEEEAPGPSSGAADEGPLKRYRFRSVFDGRSTTMWPLTRSVSSLCMTSPGPSSASEKGQKRKNECGCSGSKRIKREEQNGHSEEEPAEAVNGTAEEEDTSGPSSVNNIQVEMNSDNSSDSSSDEDNSVVYMLRGKKYVRKLAKDRRRSSQREVHPDDIPGPEPIISDLCVMSFAEGNSVQNNNNGNGGRGIVNSSNLWYVRLMYPELTGGRPNLHTLILRNFSRITDQSLRLLTDHSSLRYLDVSGTSVTESAVLDFKLRRPEVEVISDFEVPF